MTMPLSEGLCINPAQHTLSALEGERATEYPSMLQLDTVPGWRGLQSQKHTFSDKIRILEAKFSQIGTKTKLLKKNKCFSSVMLDPETAEGI